MRVSTLIAATDTAYTGHISEYISEYHADTMEISVCNTIEQLRRMLRARRYNVALIDDSLIKEADLEMVDLPLLLWTERLNVADDVPSTTRQIRKHRRISKTVADVLEQYATVTNGTNIPGIREGNITAVWSPSGGVGKTTVALAYAASKAKNDKEVFYLSLETFAATSTFFNGQGKSISTVFEMLDGSDGNIKMLIQAVRSCENGICYICAPENYDDMCILSPEHVRELVINCAGTTDELIVDLSCVYDARTQLVFELADKILLVTDCTDTAKTKLAQFVSQSDVYEGIKEKCALVANKNTKLTEADKETIKTEFEIQSVTYLPDIQETNPQYVYKTLGNHDF